MEPADVYLTHYPPFDVLDCEMVGRGQIEHYGLEKMKECLETKMSGRGLHCFGHIHGCGGMRSDFGSGSVIGGIGAWYTYSNAACNINIIEL